MKLEALDYDTKVPAGMKTLFINSTFDKKNIHSVAKCPCCNSKLIPTLNLKSKSPEIPVLSRGLCKNCGYFGVASTLTPEWLESYYLKEWTNTEAVNNIELTTSLTNDRPLKMISRHLNDKNATILDAGAGYGSSIKAFSEAGYKNIEALELSTRRANILKTRYNIKVDNTPLERLSQSPVLSKKYDVVYLWHVFEHLSRPNDCMVALSEAVKDNGLLYISVPFFPEEHFTNLVNLPVHMHSFQNFTLHYFVSRYGFELVEEEINFDGAGIRAIYRKTGPVKEKGDDTLLPSKKEILNQYNEKIFKDFQLMYLIHQKEEKRKNIILSFHYNSSFAGSCLVKYPTNLLTVAAFKFNVYVSDHFKKKTNLIQKVLRRIALKIEKNLALAQGTIFFSQIKGLPEDQYPFRLIFGTDDAIEIDFIHSQDYIKVWVE